MRVDASLRTTLDVVEAARVIKDPTEIDALSRACQVADQALAEGPASGWSWGPGQSHLDHILVTDELFPALVAPGADCRTPRIDQVLDGTYTRLLSDHLPVVVILPGSALP